MSDSRSKYEEMVEAGKIKNPFYEVEGYKADHKEKQDGEWMIVSANTKDTFEDICNQWMLDNPEQVEMFDMIEFLSFLDSNYKPLKK